MKRIIYIILIVIFSTIFLYSSYKIITWKKDNINTDKITKKIKEAISYTDDVKDEEKDEVNIDFSSLQKINKDTVAYIKVNNTNVSYPVVQTKNNSYYLTHSFDKKYNSAGWIFMDYHNKLDGSDKNIVIYGHDRKDDSMFGSLDNILKKDWYTNTDNQEIIFITPKEKTIYKIFSVYQIKVEDYYINTEFSDEEFIKFLDVLKSRSIYDFKVSLTENDSILTLSTCLSHNNNYRVVLHAVKVIN